jgi:alkanesulfonate monooxygenase SsuD/methylene tetrahydromethanopterin reductase-like flavin-dependent oxidoreductase (luciferase family)
VQRQAGAVASEQKAVRHESDSRTPAQGIEDIVDAERVGFRAAWMSERWDIKEAAVILSGGAARTSRIEIATGLVCPTTRHPWQMAAFAATMQCCYGPRFTLGLGRGDNAIFRDMGLRMSTYRELTDYVEILRTLWRGDTVSYDGPAARARARARLPPVPGLRRDARRGERLVDGACAGAALTQAADRVRQGRRPPLPSP